VTITYRYLAEQQEKAWQIILDTADAYESTQDAIADFREYCLSREHPEDICHCKRPVGHCACP